MSEKYQYFDKIVEEPVLPDRDTQTFDGDISCSSVNIPSIHTGKDTHFRFTSNSVPHSEMSIPQ
jgi:hypothetical protein